MNKNYVDYYLSNIYIPNTIDSCEQNTSNYQQLQQIYKNSIKSCNLLSSSFANSAHIYYPYHFMDQQRIVYILEQQKKLFDYHCKNMNLRNPKNLLMNYILIKKINNPRLATPEIYYYADKNNLTICDIFTQKSSQYGIDEFTLKKQFSNKLRKAITFTKSSNSNIDNSIGCLGKQINSCHLKLRFSQTQELENTAISCFIYCWKFAPKPQRLSKIPYFCVNKIISYANQYNKYKFELISFTKQSNNRPTRIDQSYLQIIKQIQLSNDYNLRQIQYRLNANFAIKLKFIKIIAFDEKVDRSDSQSEVNLNCCNLYKKRIMNQLNTVMETVHSVSVSLTGITEFEQTLPSEFIKTKNLETLLVKIKTSTYTRYHILSNYKSEFTIGNGNFDISIPCTILTRGEQQAKIRYSKQNKKWTFQSSLIEGIWIKMKSKESYGIRGTNIVRVGLKNFFQIEIPD